MNYLTWRELREKLNSETSDAVLDEPAMFSLVNEYGDEQLFPMEIIRDTWHPDDQPRTLCYNSFEDEYQRLADHEDASDYEPLRRLPPNALLLAFSEMEEDLGERTAWLTA